MILKNCAILNLHVFSYSGRIAWSQRLVRIDLLSIICYRYVLESYKKFSSVLYDHYIIWPKTCTHLKKGKHLAYAEHNKEYS